MIIYLVIRFIAHISYLNVHNQYALQMIVQFYVDITVILEILWRSSIHVVHDLRFGLVLTCEQEIVILKGTNVRREILEAF